MKKFLLFAIIMLPLFSGCNSRPIPYLEREVDSITKSMVPDKREGICNVNIYIRGKELVLKGESDSYDTKAAFVKYLNERNIEFTDSLIVLPDSTAISKYYGLVSVSVCNIRSGPSHDEEMVSQALMGTPARILKYEGGWYLVQTPDSYIGWVDNDAIELKDESEFTGWKSSERLIWLESFGFVYGDDMMTCIISDITAGAILELKEDQGNLHMVVLPDGRKGFIQKSGARLLSEWSAGTVPEATNLLKSAFRLNGTPYLWGGTSPKGVDCSGFVKTFYFLNGMILARDVSLMYRHGKVITDFTNTDTLKQGDLLFFGTVKNGKPRPTHIGMYIGDTEFIHSSGMVRVNSLDSARSNFSRYRRDTFLGARRIVGENPGKGMLLVSGHNWYFN